MSNIEVVALRTAVVLVVPQRDGLNERFIAHSPAEALDLAARIVSAANHIGQQEEAEQPVEQCKNCKRPKKSSRHRCVGMKGAK